jgi:hypothetical protein
MSQPANLKDRFWLHATRTDVLVSLGTFILSTGILSWIDAYTITSRRRFKCKACLKQFSVTSGTIFASRKMSSVDLLAAICIIVNGAKGISALQLARDLDCQHKTAFVLAHKLRESMKAETHNMMPDGEVEIDGVFFHGHVRPANEAVNRVDRRLTQNQTGKRRVAIALRQRKGALARSLHVTKAKASILRSLS